MKILYWRTPNGVVGHGGPVPQGLAEAWLLQLQKEYPWIEHWLVPVTNPAT